MLPNVEVVSQSEPVAASDFKHLMLAVAIKRSPLDTAAADAGITPIEFDRSSFMTNKQLPAGVSRRETDD